MAALEDDEYEIPLRDQRYFGAGIKRMRIQFVPSSSQASANTRLPTSSSQSAADKYLSIVLKEAQERDESTTSALSAQSTEPKTSPEAAQRAEASDAFLSDVRGSDTASRTVCDICHRAITSRETTTPHESSIAHQICLEHSHPPNHVDRKRRGLAILESHDWDPDGRKGLGAEGKGILHPIKAKENKDRAGLGAVFDGSKANVKPKVVKLDAGKVRTSEKDKKLKGEKLRDLFYRNEDIDGYLGGG